MMNFPQDKIYNFKPNDAFPVKIYYSRWLSESTVHICHDLGFDGHKFQRFIKKFLSVHATESDVSLYAGAAGMLLHINWKFTMGTFK